MKELTMSEELEGNDQGLSKDERNWGMICHLSALSGLIIPFGTILGPIIVWAIKKDELPFVDRQGKEAINFQLTMTIVIIISWVLLFALIGLLLLPAAILYTLVMIVIAAIKANDGEEYSYPYTIRFFK